MEFKGGSDWARLLAFVPASTFLEQSRRNPRDRWLTGRESLDWRLGKKDFQTHNKIKERKVGVYLYALG